MQGRVFELQEIDPAKFLVCAENQKRTGEVAAHKVGEDSCANPVATVTRRNRCMSSPAEISNRADGKGSCENLEVKIGPTIILAELAITRTAKTSFVSDIQRCWTV